MTHDSFPCPFSWIPSAFIRSWQVLDKEPGPITWGQEDSRQRRVGLSDAHIQAAHLLLRKQYPHQNSLQSTLWLQFLLKWDSDPDDFVQIINISGQHWVCASNVNCPPGIVDVYDSIPSYSIGSQSLRLQLAAILQTQEPQFHICFVDVQFAIANATVLCGGLDPYPTKLWAIKEVLSFQFVATKPVDVFYKCRFTCSWVHNQLGDLLQCEICKKWFHEDRVDRTKFEHPQSHCWCTKCFL